jgi:hypothetical protein
MAAKDTRGAKKNELGIDIPGNEAMSLLTISDRVPYLHQKKADDAPKGP